MGMSTELTTSHSFPKDRTVGDSNLSPIKQSAGDDDEICRTGPQRTRVHAIYFKPHSRHWGTKVSSGLVTPTLNVGEESKLMIVVYFSPVLCLLCLSFRVDPISRNHGDWSIVEDVPSSNLYLVFSVQTVMIIIQTVLLYCLSTQRKLPRLNEILRQIYLILQEGYHLAVIWFSFKKVMGPKRCE